MSAQKPIPQSVHNVTDNDLPEGWVWTVTSQVTKNVPNVKPADEPERIFGYVDISSICNGTFRIIDRKRFKGNEAPSRARRPIRPGDVLFSNVRTYLRNVALVSDGLDAQVCSTGFTVLRSNGAIEPSLLFYQVLTDRFIDLVTPQQTGSQYPATSDRVVMSAAIPLPPLAEQKRIFAKVEELLAQVNAARDRLAKVPKILKRFRQSVLAAACSGRLTHDWRIEHTKIQPAAAEIADTERKLNDARIRRGVPDTVDVPEELSQIELPSTWVLKSVGELIRCGALVDVKDGNHGADHPKAIEFSEEGLPFITAAQVKNYHIDYSGAPKVAGKPLQRLRVGFAKVGDAVLTHKGTVGRAALNTQACVLTPQTTYYRCKQEVLHANYLVYFFTSPQFYQQLAAVMSQTTRDFVPISGQYRLFLFVPPPLEQHEIVRRVEALFKLADVIEKRVEAATKRADKLTQAILAKAFRGELVPAEAELARRERRTYEPASALLERIRGEREAESEEKTKLNPSHKARKIHGGHKPQEVRHARS